MSFESIPRIDMDAIAKAFRDGHVIRVFRQPTGWSVQCVNGLLVANGVDRFEQLLPLLEVLKQHGVQRMTVEP